MLTSSARRAITPVFVCLLVAALAFGGLAAAKDNWIEVKSTNFIVVSNAGEGEARRIADQFEKFREMFHESFPSLRLDLGKPLVIIAVKNEDGMKMLLPGYWEVKGRVHPAGYFMPGEERDCVAVQTSVEAEFPYEVVYHEYTHALMDLNFRGLPIWLGEGLAEYFGNSTIQDKDVKIGKISEAHLMELKQNRLIPIDALLQADAHSPYYNEQNRAGVFYAESWAIVHYLMTDPDARKRLLLDTFLKEWDATGKQVEAAQKTFGDLKKFGSAMESYARQHVFYIVSVKVNVHGDAKSYPLRQLSPSEVAAYTSIFLTHTGRLQESQTQASEALRDDPNLAFAHEASGLLSYFKQDFPHAEAEFKRATELSVMSAPAFYYLAASQMRQGATQMEQMKTVTAALEKAIELDPQFAPAYSALSQFYSMNSETHDKAFATGKKALELEPGNLHYATNFGYVLINIGKIPEAKYLAGRIIAAAKDPQGVQMGESLRQAAEMREGMGQYVQVRPAATAQSSSAPPSATKDISVHDSKETSPTSPEASSAPASSLPPPATAPGPVGRGPEYRLEGKVMAATCKLAGEVTVTLSINTVLMKFHAADAKSLEITPDARAIASAGVSCAAWKAQRAEVVFHGNSAGEFDGELIALHFR
jgi:tetratricopeptide (TPR) repeat protein